MSERSVLIVDDEKNIRLTLALALEKLNLPVDTAGNGDEALSKLAEKSYALMLLDLRMPGHRRHGSPAAGRTDQARSQGSHHHRLGFHRGRGGGHETGSGGFPAKAF